MRNFHLILGIGLVLLAAAGIVLPLLPTTPFLLLAAGCFGRSSPRCSAWLTHTPLFGSLLRDWQRHGVVRPKAKAAALGSMALFGGSAVVVGGFTWIINALLLTSMSIAASVVLRLPSAHR